MTKSNILLFALLFTGFSRLNAQVWTVHLNGNEYYPIHAGEKGYYPILWYSSTEGRGVLLGGFGGGVSCNIPVKDEWRLKTQLNVFRSRYYDEPVLFVDEVGQSLGAYIGITTNLNATLLFIPQYRIGSRFTLGAGLGLFGTLLSKTDYGDVISQGEKKSAVFTNRSIQPAVLTVPIEVSVGFFRRMSLSVRFETSLTKVSKLPSNSGERFIAGFVELGYRIGSEAETALPSSSSN